MLSQATAILDVLSTRSQSRSYNGLHVPSVLNSAGALDRYGKEKEEEQVLEDKERQCVKCTCRWLQGPQR